MILTAAPWWMQILEVLFAIVVGILVAAAALCAVALPFLGGMLVESLWHERKSRT